jgi:hypothetical protein
MKKLACLLTIALFLFVGCATNRTMQGAGAGAGAGGLASIIAGKSGSTAALLIMGGALLGGLIGNTMDQQAQQASMQPENRGKTVMVIADEPKQGTNCSKVTKRSWKDGKMINETIEEVCDGRKSTSNY